MENQTAPLRWKKYTESQTDFTLASTVSIIKDVRLNEVLISLELVNRRGVDRLEWLQTPHRFIRFCIFWM
jgi:hypothetical protein